MDPIYISELIRGDFQSVLQFKMRGDAIEVFTPFAMENRDIVSVFVRQDGIAFVCAVELDMGRLRKQQKNRREAIERRNGIFHLGNLYYKKVYSPQVIGSAIVDLAEFAVACSWLFGVKPGDEK